MAAAVEIRDIKIIHQCLRRRVESGVQEFRGLFSNLPFSPCLSSFLFLFNSISHTLDPVANLSSCSTLALKALIYVLVMYISDIFFEPTWQNSVQLNGLVLIHFSLSHALMKCGGGSARSFPQWCKTEASYTQFYLCKM